MVSKNIPSPKVIVIGGQRLVGNPWGEPWENSWGIELLARSATKKKNNDKNSRIVSVLFF